MFTYAELAIVILVLFVLARIRSDKGTLHQIFSRKICSSNWILLQMRTILVAANFTFLFAKRTEVDRFFE